MLARLDITFGITVQIFRWKTDVLFLETGELTLSTRRKQDHLVSSHFLNQQQDFNNDKYFYDSNSHINDKKEK